MLLFTPSSRRCAIALRVSLRALRAYTPTLPQAYATFMLAIIMLPHIIISLMAPSIYARGYYAMLRHSRYAPRVTMFTLAADVYYAPMLPRCC